MRELYGIHMKGGVITERDPDHCTLRLRLPAGVLSVEKMRGVADIAERYGTTTAAVAIAWTLSWPGVTGAIVGARSAEQVDGWIQAATHGLTAEDLDEIAIAIDSTGAGAGPPRP